MSTRKTGKLGANKGLNKRRVIIVDTPRDVIACATCGYLNPKSTRKPCPSCGNPPRRKRKPVKVI